MITPKLSTHETRSDLTDRECAKIICGLIGGLGNMATMEDIRKAVEWIANQDQFWSTLETQQAYIKAVMNGSASTTEPTQ